ncbi:MAG TPA: peptidylprolyl isomerase, partial [Longimicrobiaceae bacterium]|nr:peptidylprolyl isomerase [Longimicrobiaceae bacterium]
AVDVAAFTAPLEEQAVIIQFMDQTLHPDTTFTGQELEKAWAEEGPGVEVRARHILLRIPTDATPAQRDSVKQLAETLRQKALNGADFAKLAEQYSQDPASARKGGDLGFFGHGSMVQSFDEAAFKLKPGEISPVVESPFGYHIIKVEARRQQPMGDQHDRFETYMKQKRVRDAETAYLDSLSAAADVQVQPGGLAVVKEIAKRPEQQLRGRAAKREIATYDKGAFTTGDFLAFIRTQSPQVQKMFTEASDEDLKTAIEQMTRKELLLQAAKEKGISLDRAEQDSIRSNARKQIHQVVTLSGLNRIAGTRASGKVIDSTVTSMLQGLVQQQLNLPPLGRFGYALRDVYPAEINEGTFQQVVDRVQEIRESQPAPQGPPMPQGAVPQPSAPADTAA